MAVSLSATKNETIIGDGMVFVQQQLAMRERSTSSNNILHIQFENLIFDYDDFVKRIRTFFGLSMDEHLYPKKYFNPEISIKMLVFGKINMKVLRHIDR
jgi:hypothetical protein